MAKLDYRWRLREVMAARNMWATTDLAPLLSARGIDLSPAQVYRLVTQTPERLSLKTLMALCDALECISTDLIEPVEVAAGPRKRKAAGAGTGGEVRPLRPKRARIVPER
ncbi:MAG TPA: helix-turn-helix transcriptional regulator [Acidimicrobiales bacterium]|nr:helix-turn-helix transcriptional regulator [Acidimicrobiales bacterium]